jgi:hypothetical protein
MTPNPLPFHNKMIGMTFKSSLQIISDIHNGGTIFFGTFYEILKFGNENNLEIRYEVVRNGWSKNYKEIKENQLWTGSYNSRNGHILAELITSDGNKTRKIYFGYIDNEKIVGIIYEKDIPSDFERNFDIIYTQI